jgi:predicted RNase H-like nuclease
MRVVLGIDASWTETNASGVALAAAKGPRGWKLITAVSSYQDFDAQIAQRSGTGRSTDLVCHSDELLASAKALSGYNVDLIAVDLPLARSSIRGRRTADDAVSRAYGGRKCGTHSPTPIRPGRISCEIASKRRSAAAPGSVHPPISRLVFSTTRVRQQHERLAGPHGVDLNPARST